MRDAGRCCAYSWHLLLDSEPRRVGRRRVYRQRRLARARCFFVRQVDVALTRGRCTDTWRARGLQALAGPDAARRVASSRAGAACWRSALGRAAAFPTWQPGRTLALHAPTVRSMSAGAKFGQSAGAPCCTALPTLYCVAHVVLRCARCTALPTLYCVAHVASVATQHSMFHNSNAHPPASPLSQLKITPTSTRTHRHTQAHIHARTSMRSARSGRVGQSTTCCNTPHAVAPCCNMLRPVAAGCDAQSHSGRG
jgi:hypothetical protein